MINANSSDPATLKELGQRIARARLNKNMTQEQLATEAGISLPTVQRMERGHSTQTANLIRILRALKILENLDALIPQPPISPMQQIKLQGRKRQRASSVRKPKTSPTWNWGDEK